ncbi:MAG: type II secretion system protein [Micavibrio sp.]
MTALDKLKTNNRQDGFTLIEISIGMLILGILLVPALQLYNINQKKAARIDTINNIERMVQPALARFVSQNGFYPLPADPSIAIGDADSGQEVALASIATACTATVTDVCVTNIGSINADGVGAADDVFIGDIPYAALGLPYQAILDGYGYKMKYAVTANLARGGTFNNGWGAIEVLNDERNTTAPATGSAFAIGTPKGHYAIVSHGQDSRGAFNQSGTRTEACGTAANGLDFENCDNDAVFKNNQFQYEDIPDTTPGVSPDSSPQMNLAAGANYFHDFVGTTSTITSGMWSDVPSDQSITSTQNGNVQIGPLNSALQATCTEASCLPVAKVNVTGVTAGSVAPGNVAPFTQNGSMAGNARAAGVVRTDRICNTGSPLAGSSAIGRDCGNTKPIPYTATEIPSGWFTPGVIGSTPPILTETAADEWNNTYKANTGHGIRCLNDRGMYAIVNFDERCRDTVRVDATTNTTLGDCVAGTYAVGIRADGSLICE